MLNYLEFTDLFSTDSSLIGQHLTIKGYLIVEVSRCYLLKDEEASEYSAKIEVYAPGLEKKYATLPPVFTLTWAGLQHILVTQS